MILKTRLIKLINQMILQLRLNNTIIYTTHNNCYSDKLLTDAGFVVDQITSATYQPTRNNDRLCNVGFSIFRN